MTKNTSQIPAQTGKPTDTLPGQFLGRLGDAIYKFTTPVSTGMSYLAMILVCFMVLGVVFDVTMRYFDISLRGIYELQTYLMVTVTYFSIAYVTIEKRHIVIDLVTSRLSAGAVSLIAVINNIFAVIIMCLMVWRTTLFMLDIFALGTYTAMLRLPVWGMAAIITIGLFIFLLVVTGDLLKSMGHALSVLEKRWLLIAAVLIPMFVFTIPYWLTFVSLSRTQIGIMAVFIMLALIFLSLPVAFAMTIGGFVGCTTITSWDSAFKMLGSLPYSQVADFFLTVIPFFVLMGSLATVAGISRDLYDTFKTWLGRLPGSLAMATIAGGAAFGAVCGDSVATAAAMGRAALPEMKKMNYADSLMGGSVAVAGTLGIMIPPSTVFIIYALLAEQSVGLLFMAGILPGIVTAGLMMLTVAIMVKRKPELAPRGEGSGFVQKVLAARKTWGMILLFILVMGGIYTGKFTPVEAGAIGAFGAFVFSLFRRRLSLENMKEGLLDAAAICGMIFIIMVGVGLLNATLALSRIPIALVQFVEELEISRWFVFGGIVLMYVILGCILNIMPVIMLTVPILMPTILHMQFDPIWFGVIIVLMTMIGQVTPPVGLVGYVVKGLAPEMSLTDIFKGLTPLWITMIVSVILISLFPQIALFIPHLVM